MTVLEKQNITAGILPEFLTNNSHLKGLSQDEVLAKRKEFGENRLPVEKHTSAWILLLNQVKSPLVYIILTAAAVSLIVGEMGDFAIIMAVVVVDVILGFAQEYQAQRTYVALKGLLKPTTTVLRDGQRQEIEIWELVPGDLVILNSGEHIPGDGKLLDCSQLAVDEAILTGESEAVHKNAVDGEDLVYMGTTVVSGRAVMQVAQIGSRTELGKIATSLQEHVEEDTPLQVRLKAFSKTLTYIVIVATVLIMAAGILMGRPFLDMLRTSIVLSIAAVPEGLLIAVTVILVLGMRKIFKRNGLVKKLLAVETLGSVTTICTDKTGTLTEGRMRITRTDFVYPDQAIQTMVLCNDLEGPVDMALWEYAESLEKASPQDLLDGSRRLAEEMFTSETKFMITSCQVNGDGYLDFLKGAPDIIVDMCQFAPGERTRILAQVDTWAGEGLRLLGLAFRPQGNLADHSGYTWAGLIGMEDPVREGVIESIQVAHKAGVEVKMITGDYRLTAERIARNIGLMKTGDEVLEGEQLSTLSDEQLKEKVRKTSIFSRIRPHDKLRIVKALQSNGEVAAMVGDGVNDAPALQRANIGVVVGSATDVAKETADLILLDNNFRTVVAAIEEGRIIFENIRKVVAYTLSNSFAEVITIFTAMLFHWPVPLAVAQILWIHLICDGPSDIVLGFEPGEKGIMEEKPRALNEPILGMLGGSLIGIISIASSIFALGLFSHFYMIHNNAVEGRSIVFASFAVNSMIYIFGYRSMRRSLLHMQALSKNTPLLWAVAAGLLMVLIAFIVPGIRSLLGIVPLSLAEWGIVAGMAALLLLIVELGKFANRKLRVTS